MPKPQASSLKPRIGLVLTLAAYAAQIAALYVAVQPGQPYQPRFVGEDKLLHFVAFAALAGLLVAGALLAGRGWWYFAGGFSGVTTGAGSEILQLWVRGRTASIGDWLMNFMGFILVISVYEFVRSWRAGGLIEREVA